MFCEKKTVDTEVDWSGRCETPAGAAGQVRPHRRLSAEDAHRPPRRKRAPGAEINHTLFW
ncbi:MAG: hypothetical protein K0S25_311 [Bacillus sp. (in: firmicutes)]|nr:hypothetical protein [Bacillus sp. (in: firmicutes)]